MPFPLPTSTWLRLAALTAIALAALTAAFGIRLATADLASAAPTPAPTLFLAGFEEEETESEVEEEAEEEWEEDEEGAEPLPDDVCPLRSASAHASTKHDKLKLTIGYITNEPFSARITIQRGSVQLATARRHLGHSGVLRFSEKLDEDGGKKIVANIVATGKSAGCPSRRLVLFPR